MNEIDYEDALRYILGGGRHTANAEVFHEAVMTEDWTNVADGLKQGLKRLQADADQLDWENQRFEGEVKLALGGAEQHLTDGSTTEHAFLAVCRLLYAAKAFLSALAAEKDRSQKIDR